MFGLVNACKFWALRQNPRNQGSYYGMIGEGNENCEYDGYLVYYTVHAGVSLKCEIQCVQLRHVLIGMLSRKGMREVLKL